jgi:hypothetical protein
MLFCPRSCARGVIRGCDISSTEPVCPTVRSRVHNSCVSKQFIPLSSTSTPFGWNREYSPQAKYCCPPQQHYFGTEPWFHRTLKQCDRIRKRSPHSPAMTSAQTRRVTANLVARHQERRTAPCFCHAVTREVEMQRGTAHFAIPALLLGKR